MFSKKYIYIFLTNKVEGDAVLKLIVSSECGADWFKSDNFNTALLVNNNNNKYNSNNKHKVKQNFKLFPEY